MCLPGAGWVCKAGCHRLCAPNDLPHRLVVNPPVSGVRTTRLIESDEREHSIFRRQGIGARDLCSVDPPSLPAQQDAPRGLAGGSFNLPDADGSLTQITSQGSSGTAAAQQDHQGICISLGVG